MIDLMIKCCCCKKYLYGNQYFISCDYCSRKALTKNIKENFEELLNYIIEDKENTIHNEYFKYIDINMEKEQRNMIIKWYKNGFYECINKICKYINEFSLLETPELEEITLKFNKFIEYFLNE